MFIDIHSHIYEKYFNQDQLEKLLIDANHNNVGIIVCSGCDYDTSLLALNLANRIPNVFASIGLHPHSCFDYDEKMENLILQSKSLNKVIAIGEIGLDFFDLDFQLSEIKKQNNLNELLKEDLILKQKEVFIKQIKLANMLDLPIIIHMRDATGETLKILEDNKNLLNNSGVVHCFNGSIETAQRIINLGLYLSIGGVVTFKNAKSLPAILPLIGLDKIVLETDSPYLAPDPYRGSVNEPKNILYIANKIANIFSTSLETVEDTTSKNVFSIFKRLHNGKF